MVKHTQLQKDHTGDDILYSYDNFVIKVFPYFLYEVIVYKYSKYEYEVLGNKYYKSDTLLSIKYYNMIKYFKGYTIEYEISLIGAPENFIKENKLKEYQIVAKLKTRKR